MFKQDEISYNLGPDSDKKESHESDNDFVEDEDDICLDKSCDNVNLYLNKSELDDNENRDTKRYESSCGEDSVAGRNDG